MARRTQSCWLSIIVSYNHLYYQQIYDSYIACFKFIDHLGFQHFELGQIKEALENFETAAKLDQHSYGKDEAARNNGVWYYNKGLMKLKEFE